MKLNFCEKLNELMEEKKITSLALSKIVGVSASTILRWKNGEMCPTIDKLALLCDYFGVTADYLLGFED